MSFEYQKEHQKAHHIIMHIKASLLCHIINQRVHLYCVVDM